jgi:hypothetical protein
MRREYKRLLRTNWPGLPALGSAAVNGFHEAASGTSFWQGLPWGTIAAAFFLVWVGSLYRDLFTHRSHTREFFRSIFSRLKAGILFDPVDAVFRVKKAKSEDVRVAIRAGRRRLRNPVFYIDKLAIRERTGWRVLNKARIKIKWPGDGPSEFVIEKEDELIPVFDMIPADSNGGYSLRVNAENPGAHPSVDLQKLAHGFYQMSLAVKTPDRSVFGTIFVIWTGSPETIVICQHEDDLADDRPSS